MNPKLMRLPRARVQPISTVRSESVDQFDACLGIGLARYLPCLKNAAFLDDSTVHCQWEVDILGEWGNCLVLLGDRALSEHLLIRPARLRCTVNTRTPAVSRSSR